MQNDNIAENQPPAGTPGPATQNAQALEPDLPEKLTGFAKLRQAVTAALDKTRPQQKPGSNRRELGADKSKTVLALGGLGIALILVFLGVFSQPNKKATPGAAARNQPNLGRKVTPGSERNDPNKSATPLLDAKVQPPSQGDNGDVTPEDVNRTSTDIPRYKPQVPPDTQGKKNEPTQAKSLKTVSFGSGSGPEELAPPPSAAAPPVTPKLTLNKPSIVFVRSDQGRTTAAQNSPAARAGDINTLSAIMPPGTKLLARLQAPVSSAVSAPVVAVVEYNYERNGTIVFPAGAKVIGKLAQASPSGLVNIQFTRVEMPDGTTEKIDGSAMSLSYGPLKGSVTGQKKGTRFLVSSLTGLGTVASFLVGAHPSSTLDAPISESTLLRERLADNIGQAGQQELNSLGFSQNIVVTIPGNTRFYVVLQKGSGDEPGRQGPSSAARPATAAVGNQVPTVEELRQLLELRREINQLYQQPSAAANSQSTDQ